MKNNTITYSERGAAISLSEMMIAVVVSAILIGGILAALFGVIPWAQDEVAKRNLAEIAKAQEIYKVENAALAGSNVGVEYGELQQEGDSLTKYIKASPTEYCSTPDTNGNYFSYAVSGSGKVFMASNSNKNPVEVARAQALAACPDLVVSDGDNPPAAFDPNDPWNIEDVNLRAAVKTVLGVGPADDLLMAHAIMLDNSYEVALFDEVKDSQYSILWDVSTFAGLEHATNYTRITSGALSVCATDLRALAAGTSLAAPLTLTDFRGLDNIQEIGMLLAADHGADCDFDTTPLSNLRTVTTSLGIDGISHDFSLAGLNQTPSINVYNNSGNVSFPALTQANAVMLEHSSGSASFPVLTTIGSHLYVTNSSIQANSFPQLVNTGTVVLGHVSQGSVISFPSFTTSNMLVVGDIQDVSFNNAFPSVVDVASLTISNSVGPASSLVPNLRTADVLSIHDMPLDNANFANLTRITTRLSIDNITGNVTNSLFPVLDFAGNISISQEGAAALNMNAFNALTTVQNNILITLNTTNPSTVQGFNNLTSVNNISIQSDNGTLRNAFQSLQTIQRNFVTTTSTTGAVGTTIEDGVFTNLTEVVGNVTIQRGAATPVFPALVTVDSLLALDGATIEERHFPRLARVITFIRIGSNKHTQLNGASPSSTYYGHHLGTNAFPALVQTNLFEVYTDRVENGAFPIAERIDSITLKAYTIGANVLPELHTSVTTIRMEQYGAVLPGAGTLSAYDKPHNNNFAHLEYMGQGYSSPDALWQFREKMGY